MVIRPYPHGKNDINGHPSQQASRWVIDFTDLNEKEARKHAGPFARIEQSVKPVRLNSASSYPNRVRDLWWQFEAVREELHSQLRNITEVLVLVQTSSTQTPVRVAANQVFDQKLVVITQAHDALLAILSSSIHKLWATNLDVSSGW